MAKAKDFRLLLFRSGLTDWDREGRLSGGADLPLSPFGRSEIERAMDLLGERRLSAVLTGPDEASVQTAEMLASRTKAKVRRVEGIGEMRLGLWEGSLGTDLVERCPTAYRQWLEDPSTVNVPEGETLAQAEERVLRELSRALDRLRDEKSTVGVVLRPVVWGLVRCWLSGLPSSAVWSMTSDPVASEERVVDRERLRGVREKSRASA